jgi:hypothetical protein
MKRSLILLTTLALSACATMGGGNSITVETAVRGQALPGVNCNVRTGSGNWNIVTPATLALGSTSGDLRILCDKPGYRTSEFVFTPTGSYGTPGSVGIGLGGGGGHVGFGVGLGFPVEFGGSRGSYPSKVTIDMNPN